MKLQSHWRDTAEPFAHAADGLVEGHEHDHAEVDHREIVGSTLLVSRGDAPELLEAVDQTLNLVALPISLAIKGWLTPLVFAGWDHRRDLPLA